MNRNPEDTADDPEPDEAPETPLDEPEPMPVQDPPSEPTPPGPYVVDNRFVAGVSRRGAKTTGMWSGDDPREWTKEANR